MLEPRASPRPTTGRFLLDGGRSSAIRHELDPLLGEMSELLGADVALALFASGRNRGHAIGRVLAWAARSGATPAPLPSEPLRLAGEGVTGRRTQAVRDVVLESDVRSYKLELASALVVPWREPGGRGWLVIGVQSPARHVAAGPLRAYAEHVRSAHRDASATGTIRLWRDLAAAVDRITRLERDGLGVAALLDGVVAATRELLGTSSA